MLGCCCFLQALRDVIQIAADLEVAKVADIPHPSRVMLVRYDDDDWCFQLMMTVSARALEDDTRSAPSDVVGECQQEQGILLLSWTTRYGLPLVKMSAYTTATRVLWSPGKPMLHFQPTQTPATVNMSFTMPAQGLHTVLPCVLQPFSSSCCATCCRFPRASSFNE